MGVNLTNIVRFVAELDLYLVLNILKSIYQFQDDISLSLKIAQLFSGCLEFLENWE